MTVVLVFYQTWAFVSKRERYSNLVLNKVKTTASAMSLRQVYLHNIFTDTLSDIAKSSLSLLKLIICLTFRQVIQWHRFLTTSGASCDICHPRCFVYSHFLSRCALNHLSEGKFNNFLTYLTRIFYFYERVRMVMSLFTVHAEIEISTYRAFVPNSSYRCSFAVITCNFMCNFWPSKFRLSSLFN